MESHERLTTGSLTKSTISFLRPPDGLDRRVFRWPNRLSHRDIRFPWKGTTFFPIQVKVIVGVNWRKRRLSTITQVVGNTSFVNGFRYSWRSFSVRVLMSKQFTFSSERRKELRRRNASTRSSERNSLNPSTKLIRRVSRRFGSIANDLFVRMFFYMFQTLPNTLPIAFVLRCLTPISHTEPGLNCWLC